MLSETSMQRAPAVLGGIRTFPEGLPFVRPAVPDGAALSDELRDILASRVLTNGARVRELERRCAEFLGVKHCVAVSSCTAGLMLVLRALELSGDVVLPSFTFSATAHAVSWNGLQVSFADVDPETLTLSADAALGRLGLRTSCILATHTYGTPCDVDALTAIARHHGLKLVFDAAHAFGSTHAGARVGGFGDAEVFSLSPTKVLVAGEGGIIATNDDTLAERARIGRDYGNPGDYDCRFVGLNARMSEVHAAIALGSLRGLTGRLERRTRLAERYREALRPIPGITFPALREGDTSTYKDFTILVEHDGFGLDASGLAAALEAEGIDTRRYYVPPVHQQRAYRFAGGPAGDLPVTRWASSRVLSLPFWSDLTESDVARVGEAVGRIHAAADDVAALWRTNGAARAHASSRARTFAAPEEPDTQSAAPTGEAQTSVAASRVVDITDGAVGRARRAATAVAQLGVHLAKAQASMDVLAAAFDDETDPGQAAELRASTSALRRVLGDQAEEIIGSARALADRALARVEGPMPS